MSEVRVRMAFPEGENTGNPVTERVFTALPLEGQMIDLGNGAIYRLGPLMWVQPYGMVTVYGRPSIFVPEMKLIRVSERKFGDPVED